MGITCITATIKPLRKRRLYHWRQPDKLLFLRLLDLRMKKICLFIILTFLTSELFAQLQQNPYAEIDKRVLGIGIPESGSTQDIANSIVSKFKSDSDRTRAIFVWITDNIEYDIANMYALNFYEKREEKIAKALKTRKGICEHYAALFTDLCQKCGIKSFVITGYTKQNGFADYIPHAWSAARVNGTWFLFDPTWGSGYVNNGKFIKKLNNSYYKTPPARLVRTHMPFDPMWEFLNYPVTNQEFYEGNVTENKTKPFFSFTDSIAQYEQQDSITQLSSEARRIEGNGIKNAMIFDRLAHIKAAIEDQRNRQSMAAYNAKVAQYNSAVSDFNEGVNDFNSYIDYWNKQFKPMRPDNEIQELFDVGYNKILSAQTKLKTIPDPDEKIKPMVTTLQKSVEDALARAREQQDWLKRYLSRSKLMRPTMFMKRG